MATVTSNTAVKPRRSKARIAGYIAAAVLLLAAIWLIFNFSTLRGNARLGSAYAAHIACSCRYIAGRDLNSCRGDLEPGMELVSLADDPANKRIAASVPLLANASAQLRGQNGCQQLNAAELAE